MIEVAAFVCGVVLRLAMLTDFAPESSYDFHAHWKYASHYLNHYSLAPLLVARTGHHPPFYYMLVGAFMRLGATPAVTQGISVALAIGKLGVAWIGFRRFLPKGPAVAVALLAAAVVPAS